MPNEHALAYEVVRLRRRIAELESELEQLREHQAETIDLELHTLAEAGEPALA
jgi:hypothetical protein